MGDFQNSVTDEICIHSINRFLELNNIIESSHLCYCQIEVLHAVPSQYIADNESCKEADGMSHNIIHTAGICPNQK